MGDCVIRISSRAHPRYLPFFYSSFYCFNWLPLVQQLHSLVSQKRWLHPTRPPPLTNPLPSHSFTEKDPLSAGGRVSMIQSPLLSSFLLSLMPKTPPSRFFPSSSPPSFKRREQNGEEASLRRVPEHFSAKCQSRRPLPSMILHGCV